MFFSLFLSIASAANVDINWKWETIGFATTTTSYFLLHNVQPRKGLLMADPKALDSLPHPTWNPNIEPFSDFLGHPLTLYGINGPVLTTIGVGTFAAISQTPEEGLAHSFIVCEALVVNALITEAIKLSVARPRPFTSLQFQEAYPDAYNGSIVQEEIDGFDAYKSFPSGHTSSAAASYFSAATLLANSTDNTVWKIISYSSAAVLTGLAGWSRVHYGVHHPTDVIAGAVLGSSIGIGTALLHIER